MATREEWQRLINLSHELALVEDDLREWAIRVIPSGAEGEGRRQVASDILFERFGLDAG